MPAIKPQRYKSSNRENFFRLNYYDIFARNMRAGILLVLFFLNAGSGWSQSTEIIKDLRNSWKVSDGDRLEDYQGQNVHTIHLLITDQFNGGVISIKAPGEFTLFINGQLQLRTKSEIRLKVDSLRAVRAGTPLLSIFQNSNVKTVQTDFIVKASLENERFTREPTDFNDFVILSALLLFGFFVILFRSNTRLTTDYLNLAKVFSIQEREEAIVTGRIGSSVNILFFVFISLLLGLLLMILFHLGPPVLNFSSKVSIQSTAGAFMGWLLFSIIIFSVLITKLLLIWFMSALFGFKGVVRFQFFNFIRSLYVVSVLMGTALLGYFMLEIEKTDFFYFLLASAGGFMILSAFFLYFKLLTRTSSSIFHLFSYLCGSEIIPLMILIKVLLN
jgi:Domain of unknown function (DUF4271)